MQREQIDQMLEQAADAWDMDAWLLKESRAARATLTDLLVSLRAACEAFPEHKDHITEGMQRIGKARGH
ncbi:hypothetical protein KDJ57_gp42 [Gordonia phage Catfish]|uniref:Uncharacterized protein n=1 Tax=Gordonia phage Catfish TaxID=2301538 RepID=A0A385D0N0_9CAUD|nr:hypothetical protein KDJ57_gp42 [Gordonia phage Catfish]AXQ51903.1 hypothetical protein SEA_CATFISH_67 [Gordonia phage Catfish]